MQTDQIRKEKKKKRIEKKRKEENANFFFAIRKNRTTIFLMFRKELTIMRTENLDIRIMLNEKNITQKTIAKFLGVHEATVTRWLRTKNLNSDIRSKIIFAANYIESGRNRNQKVG